MIESTVFMALTAMIFVISLFSISRLNKVQKTLQMNNTSASYKLQIISKAKSNYLYVIAISVAIFVESIRGVLSLLNNANNISPYSSDLGIGGALAMGITEPFYVMTLYVLFVLTLVFFIRARILYKKLSKI